MRSSSGCGTDDCGRTSATSRPSTMPSPPSTRPSGSAGRRSSTFARKGLGQAIVEQQIGTASLASPDQLVTVKQGRSRPKQTGCSGRGERLRVLVHIEDPIPYWVVTTKPESCHREPAAHSDSRAFRELSAARQYAVRERQGAVDRVLGEDLADYAYTARSQSELI